MKSATQFLKILCQVADSTCWRVSTLLVALVMFCRSGCLHGRYLCKAWQGLLRYCFIPACFAHIYYITVYETLYGWHVYAAARNKQKSSVLKENASTKLRWLNARFSFSFFGYVPINVCCSMGLWTLVFLQRRILSCMNAFKYFLYTQYCEQLHYRHKALAYFYTVNAGCVFWHL